MLACHEEVIELPLLPGRINACGAASQEDASIVADDSVLAPAQCSTCGLLLATAMLPCGIRSGISLFVLERQSLIQTVLKGRIDMIRSTLAVSALLTLCFLVTGCGGDSSGSGSAIPRPEDRKIEPTPAPGANIGSPTASQGSD